VAPTASVTIVAGNKIHVTSSKSLGSTLGTLGWVSVCYAPSGGAIVSPGVDNSMVAAPANSRLLLTRAKIFSGLATGTYVVGLCLSPNTAADWNMNAGGQTSVLVFN